jgi:hypothetical protein
LCVPLDVARFLEVTVARQRLHIPFQALWEKTREAYTYNTEFHSQWTQTG